MAYESGQIVIFTVSVDAKTTATTTIQVTESNNKRFVPLSVIFELSAATAITVGASASVGANANVDDILAITATGITGLNGILVKNALGTGVAGLNTSSFAAGTTISIKVTTAAVGTSGTLKCSVIGFYQ